MDPFALSIPVGLILIASLFGRKKRKRSTEPDCAPFPWLADDVDAAIQAGAEVGICELNELSAHVADVVYPVDMNDRKITWPKAPPWSLSTAEPAAVQCLWERIKIRVNAKLAVELDSLCKPPGYTGKTPADVVGPWISPTPMPERFVRIRNMNNLTEFSRALLRHMTNSNQSFVGHPLVDDVMRIISNSPWNLTYFGTIPAVRDQPCGPYKSERKPAPYWAVQTPDGPREIIQAFCPKHEDHIAAMFAGHLPNRTIDEVGNVVLGGPKTWGVLWMPAMHLEMIGSESVVASGGTWSDGSTKLAPPPEVLDVLS